MAKMPVHLATAEKKKAAATLKANSAASLTDNIDDRWPTIDDLFYSWIRKCVRLRMLL